MEEGALHGESWGEGIGVFWHAAPPTRLCLEFPRETGLILMCARKVGNAFQTKQGPRHVGGLLGVAGRLSGTVSPFRAEQEASLETPSRARASSCQEVGTTWFFSSSVQFSSVTQSCPTLCDPVDCNPPGSSVHGISQTQILQWVCHFFLQVIFLTEESNLGLLRYRQILYHLSYQGSPRILECENNDALLLAT